MEQCESPDSTVNTDSNDDFGRSQLISPSNCRYENVGGAPKLIIKSVGSGSFQSTTGGGNSSFEGAASSQLVPPPKLILKRGPPQLVPRPTSSNQMPHVSASSGDGHNRSIEKPTSYSHSLQKMGNNVDDMPDTTPPPVYLKNPRFLTGPRNFLKTTPTTGQAAPRRSLPGLQPISSTLGPVAKKPMLQAPRDTFKSTTTIIPIKKSFQKTENKGISSSGVTFSSITPSNLGTGIKLQIRREGGEVKLDSPQSNDFKVNSLTTFNSIPSKVGGGASVDSSSSTYVPKNNMKIDVSNVVTNMMKPAVTKSLSIRPLKIPTSDHVRPYKKKIQGLLSQNMRTPPQNQVIIQTIQNNSLEKNGQIHENLQSMLHDQVEDSPKEHEASEPIAKLIITPSQCLNSIGQDLEASARRTGRRRKPTKHFMTDMFVPVPTTRRRKENNEEPDAEEEIKDIKSEPLVDNEQIQADTDGEMEMVVTSSEVDEVLLTPTRGRGRPRGTGRGRGRPRGSTMKAKIERMALEALAMGTTVISPSSGESTSVSPVKDDIGTPENQSPEKPLPLEGDTGVNDSLNINSDSCTPSPKKRGRGRGRGSRGSDTPRGSLRGTRRASRGRGGRKHLRTPKIKKEKSPLSTPIILEPSTPVQVFEEETRMSADIKPVAVDKIVTIAPSTVLNNIQDEESRASNISSTSTSNNAAKIQKRPTKEWSEEFLKPVTAETLFEYQWPLNNPDAEYYFLQEQVTEFVGQKSFRRKYPNLKRRTVEMEERDFIREQKAASETQCDLGLTAINSSEVLDIMFNDFPEKYELYRKVVEERRERELTRSTVLPVPGPVPIVRDRSAEFMRRMIRSCSQWNTTFNQQRKEDRSYSFDLQTGTLNVPSGKYKVLPSNATKVGHYPVAVLPGQFCDSYKSYTPTELKYLPLNTVMYGPVVENENADDSADSDSDSNESSSSEDSSCSSSDEEGEVIKSESGNEGMNGDMISNGDKADTQGVCKSCNGNYYKNKDGRQEILIHCAKCDSANHPTCLELTLDMVPFIKKYNWQCTDCKNCIECNDPADEDKMLFCDCCDRGYHIYCVGLRKVPTGRWHCITCSVCHSCGVNEPSSDDRAADWHHEYKKGEKGAKYFLHSLCVSCHKIYKKGQFCPSCLKCHLKLDDKNLLECRNCEKWVHKQCVKRQLQTMFGFMCDVCNTSFTARTKLPSRRN